MTQYIDQKNALYYLSLSDNDLRFILESIAETETKGNKNLKSVEGLAQLFSQVRENFKLFLENQINERVCNARIIQIIKGESVKFEKGKPITKDPIDVGSKDIPTIDVTTIDGSDKVALSAIEAWEKADWLTDIEKQALFSTIDPNYDKSLILDYKPSGLRNLRDIAFIKIKINRILQKAFS